MLLKYIYRESNKNNTLSYDTVMAAHAAGAKGAKIAPNGRSRGRRQGRQK